MDYKIIKEESIEELEKTVNNFLKIGYNAVGAVVPHVVHFWKNGEVLTECTYMQTLIRKKGMS